VWTCQKKKNVYSTNEITNPHNYSSRGISDVKKEKRKKKKKERIEYLSSIH
jgi:hypothetical protein